MIEGIWGKLWVWGQEMRLKEKILWEEGGTVPCAVESEL